MNVQISLNMSFDVEVELGMSGLRVNYTMSNASSVIVWKVIAVIT